jgi:hypothetical protein
MKRMKPNTCAIYRMDCTLSHYVDTRTGKTRKRWWTKTRVPGAVRMSRMPGGSGYRGDKAWEGWADIAYRPYSA